MEGRRGQRQQYRAGDLEPAPAARHTTGRVHRHTPASTLGSAARHATHAAILTLLLCAPALSQTLPPIAKTADLSGPRFGLTLLADGVVKKLGERTITVGPHISQFGWQFEKQFYTRDSGVTMVTEWVALVGGLEQSVALPSLS